MKAKYIFRAAYALLILGGVGLAYYGGSYYLAPAASRVRLPLHPILRQSGTTGHFLGILGSLFMILLLGYSLRKRVRWMRNWGTLNVWLEAHIFLGLAGPFLVLFHTDFKFSGLVQISVWAMLFVVASGVVGRYFYRLIPRSLSGMELNRIELEAEEIKLTFEIRKFLPADHPFWGALAEMDAGAGGGRESLGPPAPAERRTRRRRLHNALKTAQVLRPAQRRALSRLIQARQALLRKKRVMEKAMKVLYYWHLFHMPFVIILFLILLIHVYITVMMGHRWIF
jgi:hypothetical protein